jgi:hypothetical protein
MKEIWKLTSLTHPPVDWSTSIKTFSRKFRIFFQFIGSPLWQRSWLAGRLSFGLSKLQVVGYGWSVKMDEWKFGRGNGEGVAMGGECGFFMTGRVHIRVTKCCERDNGQIHRKGS